MKVNDRIKRGSFINSILTLTTGSLIAQIITILVSPLLTRIYTPQELGIYALILTAETLFGSIICARYDVAIISEKDTTKIFSIIKLSLVFTVIISTVATIGYGGFYFLINEDYRSYSYAIIFIYILLLLNGVMRILEAYNNRYKEYKVMTKVYVLKTSVQNFGAVMLGILKFGVFGLLLSHTLGLISGVKKQSETILPHIKKILSANKTDIKSVMKSHYRLPVYSAPAMFANRFSYASIAIFIELLFGLAVLGYYSISYKVLGLPLTVMSNNIAKVFFQEASREFDNTGKFVDSFKKTSLILFGLSIPIVLTLYFLAPLMFELVFGPGWSQAGVYVQILAPMFGVRFIVNTIAYGLQVVKKQQLELGLQILFIVASISCFFVTKLLNYDVNTFLNLITISFSTIYLIYYFTVFKFAFGVKK